jgi:hypothetical protein
MALVGRHLEIGGSLCWVGSHAVLALVQQAGELDLGAGAAAARRLVEDQGTMDILGPAIAVQVEVGKTLTCRPVASLRLDLQLRDRFAVPLG